MESRLRKSERLCAEKEIQELFDKGSSFFLYPLKVLFLEGIEGQNGVNQVLFSVSKKKIKKATGRNYIKRRMKEAYRLNKSMLEQGGHKLGLIFVGDPDMSFSEMEPKMKLALQRLQQDMTKLG
ncbi:MAG: ribonuclease P protein component [Bacteroidota bacterium]|jgi:ribonuclease P protein component|nr:ribonuclease P protein component [Algoriphagus sp.]